MKDSDDTIVEVEEQTQASIDERFKQSKLIYSSTLLSESAKGTHLLTFSLHSFLAWYTLCSCDESCLTL